MATYANKVAYENTGAANPMVTPSFTTVTGRLYVATILVISYETVTPPTNLGVTWTHIQTITSSLGIDYKQYYGVCTSGSTGTLSWLSDTNPANIVIDEITGFTTPVISYFNAGDNDLTSPVSTFLPSATAGETYIYGFEYVVGGSPSPESGYSVCLSPVDLVGLGGDGPCFTYYKTSPDTTPEFTSTGTLYFSTILALNITEAPAGGSKIVSFTVAESESIVPALKRTRRISASVSESESIAIQSINRARKVASSINENETISGSVIRDRNVTTSIVEEVAYTIALNVGLGVSLFSFSITEAESLVTALARQRNESFSIAETETIATAAINRARQIAASVSEGETVTSSIIRNRNVLPTIVETETITPSLIRDLQIAATIDENETITGDIIRARKVLASITEAETISSALSRALNPNAFTIDQTETINSSLSRNRTNALSVTEAETISQSIGRTRNNVITISQSETVTANLLRLRTVAAALAEVFDYTIDLTVSSQIFKYFETAINQTTLYDFGTIRRLRTVIGQIDEVIDYVASVIRNRNNTFTVTEQEVMSANLGILRDLHATLVETTSISMSVSRRLALQSLIQETEQVMVVLDRALTFDTAIIETETITDAIARLRNNDFSINESETIDFGDLQRVRIVTSQIVEQESVVVDFARLREMLAQIDESEEILVAINRLVGVTFSVDEQESVTVHIVRLAPNRLLVTMTSTKWVYDATTGITSQQVDSSVGYVVFKTRLGITITPATQVVCTLAKTTTNINTTLVEETIISSTINTTN